MSRNHYLMKYKGKYRVLPELDLIYHDLPRDTSGNIIHEDVALYIACQYGNRITEWGHDTNGRMLLQAYIPSIGRGRNIKKAMDAKGIPYTHYWETDVEAEFRFKAKDIEPIAELMKAKTGGANISPFSIKNLPKANVEIPLAEIERYKAVVADVQKDDLLIIHKITTSFLSTVLTKKYKAVCNKFNYVVDMKKMMMGRMAKEYIYSKEMWDEYLEYLDKKIEKFYKDKTKCVDNK